MIRKVEYTELIDNYLIDELTVEQKREFEAELEINSALAEELKLHIELQEALTEKDVINLKENLDTIMKTNKEKIKASFDLIEELQEFSEFESKVDPKELLNYYESLPKLHIYQHEIASKENVHHFYKEQELTRAAVEEEESFTDEALMLEIEEAIMEKDVLQLRDNLKQVAQSMPEHDYSQEEIDEYLSNDMPDEIRAEFEKELSMNSRLAADVKLHQEIEQAIMETEVLDLRAQMEDIMGTQASYHQEFVDIEKYLEKDLSDAEIAEFENDMFENSGLKADVELHRDVELAGAEADIMNLRDNLKTISKEIGKTEEKAVIRLNTNWKSAVVKYAVAAVVVLAIGASFIFNTQSVNNQKLYSKYYIEPDVVGVSRGADEFNVTLNNGKELYNAGQYEEASMLFRIVIDKDSDNAIPRFLLGSSLQNLKKWKEAITEYKVVVANNANTYKELAEYNLGLCYLIQDDRRRALEQFQNITKNGNHYKEEALAILRKLQVEDKD